MEHDLPSSIEGRPPIETSDMREFGLIMGELCDLAAAEDQHRSLAQS